MDKCQLTIYPNLNPDHENLAVPEEMLKHLGMAARVSKDGVTISGSDMVFNYQQVKSIAKLLAEHTFIIKIIYR